MEANNIDTAMLNQSKYQESSAQAKFADFDEPRHESGLAIRKVKEVSKMPMNKKGRDPMTISSLSPSKLNIKSSGLNVSSGIMDI